MNNQPDLSCREDRRRGDVRTVPLFGIDFIDVSDDQLTLEVFFLGKAPDKILPANVLIDGGRSIRDIKPSRVRLRRNQDPGLDDSMEITLNKSGDFSTYTLRLVKLDENGNPTDQPLDGFDPLYDSAEFSFKAGCPSDLDCKNPQICPPPVRKQPEINYLAKDYTTFRQLILDRLALIMPDWQEGHIPDLGITLVELLAYIGDYLSYYQDAVATEAYLGTARQRISVRRHARLVDYWMHEGCNARAWVSVNVDSKAALKPRDFYLITGFPGSPAPGTLQPVDVKNVAQGSFEVFEPLGQDPDQPIQFDPAHNEIPFYTWGNSRCCLRKGATSATLVDQWVPATGSGKGDQQPPAPDPTPARVPGAITTSTTVGTSRPSPQERAAASIPTSVGGGAADSVASSDGPPGTVRALHVQVGDVLLFEEVLGPKTGNPADADPAHRQAVRLTKVTQNVDPLYHPFGKDFGQPVVEIEWCSEDALQFPLCISSQQPPPDCGDLEDVSVARGNVILVDHGASTSESFDPVPAVSTSEHCPTKCSPSETSVTPAKLRPSLTGRPLTFSQPLPPCGCASAFITNDPRRALPDISLIGTLATSQGNTTTSWSAKSDLLESGPNDCVFVVEMDNDGDAHLRFGDGTLGRVPDAGTQFIASYRVGNGPPGNVGTETIVHLVFRSLTEGIGQLIPRNPLPAQGGTSPEPLEEVKMFAPYAFRKILERAITADDYASLATDNSRRLSERPGLITAINEAAAASPPSVSIDVTHKKQEEEPGEPPTLSPDFCMTPFQRLQAAKAELRWTGSWYEALVAIDPENSEEADDELLAEIDAYLEPYRRIGHDLEVKLATYVPLDLVLTVCVLPNFQRAHVEAALLDVFSNRVLADGRLGFFHPDNLTFGQGTYASRIIAAGQIIPGVQEIQVARLERFEIGEPLPGVETLDEEVPKHGVFPLGPFEIARLDNDPSVPENGRLTLNLRGGR